MSEQTQLEIKNILFEISNSLKQISASLSKAEYEKLPRSPSRINGYEYFCVKLGGLKPGDTFYLYEDIKRVTSNLDCFIVDDDTDKKYPNHILCFKSGSVSEHLFNKNDKVYILAK